MINKNGTPRGECRSQDFFLTVESLRSRDVPTLPDILRPLQSYGHFYEKEVDKMIKMVDNTKTGAHHCEPVRRTNFKITRTTKPINTKPKNMTR